MKLPYSWLKELSGVDWSPEEMAHRLTLAGSAGEVSRADPEHFKSVVIGEVLTVAQHPNADKLKVCDVNTGTGKIQVICGAPNVAVGQKVPVALPGAVLKGEFEVKEITMRGVDSAGMICSEAELGISTDHTGIMVLDGNVKLGEPLYSALELDAPAINFEITPNRPDCLSAIGLAREIAVLAGKPFDSHLTTPEEGEAKTADAVSVEIADPKGCPRYTARIISGITIGRSPWWMRKRLLDCGVRPINVIVDITNFVMLETGQPLHAFDYERFGSRRVLIRRARKGEVFTTLDGNEHELDETVLMISNGKEGVATAGVMGGLDSEVTDDTKTVLLESAYFDPSVIRKSARYLNLASESSYRFERRVDPEGVIPAADRAAQLMQELAGGKVHRGIVDAYPKKVTLPPVTLRPPRVISLIGVEIETGFMVETLRGLGCTVAEEEPLTVQPPSWRADLEREVDLIEEVARVYGYENIPTSTENKGPLYVPTHRRDTIKDDIRNILTGFGFDETVGSGFANRGKLSRFEKTAHPVTIVNPLSDEFNTLRTRMLYSLLVTAGNNMRHRNLDLKVFELGKVYRSENGAPVETNFLGLLLSGKTGPIHWQRPSADADFFALKGVVTALAEALALPKFRVEPAERDGYDRAVSCAISCGGEVLGCIGKADDKVARLFDIKQEIYAAELDVDALLLLPQVDEPYMELPKYPASARDIAVVVEERIPAAALIEEIEAAGGELVESVDLFDLYRGENIEGGRRSLAFSVSFRSPQRTLEDDEVDAAHRRIIDRLEKRFGAKLRE